MSEGARAGRLTLGQLSWTLADMGRDPFYSLVTAFIFAPYFVEHLARDPVQGQVLWGAVHCRCPSSTRRILSTDSQASN